MLFWHLGATIWIFRYVFRDPAVDLRALAAGALAANVIDVPLTMVFAPDAFEGHRAYGHTLGFALLALTVAVATTRRSTDNRKRAVAFAVGMLIHLMLDAMWTAPETLFWPAFGTDLSVPSPGTAADTLAELIADQVGNPLVLGLEALGLGYLWFLGRIAGLSDRDRRRAFLGSGHLDVLPPPAPR